MKHIFVSFAIALLLCQVAYATEVCIPTEQAKVLVVELEQKRVLEKEVAEYEALTVNLKKQNELLQEQIKLLKEQLELTKNQVQLYKVAYEEERSKRSVGLFEKAKYLGLGLGLGVMLGVFGL